PASIQVRDDGDGDLDDGDAGSVRLADLAAGTYTVTETQAPDGYLPADAQDVEVVAGEEAQVQVENQPEPTPTPTETPEPDTGSIAISNVNENGEALKGACFAVTGTAGAGPVCDNKDGDTDDTAGTIRIGGLLAGKYVVSETTPPDGYTAAADQNVTVTAGDEPATVQFVNLPTPPETGNVLITSSAQGGGSAGGGCYTVGSTAVCDNGDGDSDADPGEILFEGVVVGTYNVAETDAPDGYQQNTETKSVDVPADGEAAAEFVHEPVPPATGTVTFDLNDPNGDPVPGGCVTVSDTSNSGGTEYCDGSTEDQDPRDGILELNLETGTYSAVQSELPQAPEGARTSPTNAMANFLQDGSLNGLPEGLSLDEKTFTVKANVVIIVIIIIIIVIPENGDLVIIKRAEDTNKLQDGACFQIDGPGGNPEICDNDGVDADGSKGIIRFEDLAFGDYDVVETVAPPGYQKAADTTTTIGFGVKTITIKDKPVTATTGTLTIKKVDEDGKALKGSCFELRQNNAVVVPQVCDNANGSPNDGTIEFKDVPAGTYRTHETVLPSSDFQTPPNQTVTVVAGQNKTYTVVNTKKPGNIQITKLDDKGNGPIPGACFALERGNGIEYEVCDQESGDGDLEVGIIYFKNVPADNWTLIETQAPAGLAPAADQDITVQPGKTLNLQIKDKPLPQQPKGNLKVFKVDAKGKALAGACFSLKQGNVTIVPGVCDDDDGNNNGTITFTGVPAGTYTLHETHRPSQAYKAAPDVQVTIVANTTKTVKAVNTLKPGRVLVIKVNEKGYPLQNACFDLAPDNAGAKCTNANGQVSFDNLDSQVVYKLTETKAPPGYQLAPPKTNIAVQPGLTTQITVKDKRVPPPDNTGSIKVIKFFCPAGKGGELTTVYDSSDPGPKKLAQTANCKKGDAQFTIQRVGAEGDEVEFSTGKDGEYQATLPVGKYTLIEQKTKVKVQVEVFDGQQTTIVVLNFVKPPQPKPATVKVIKYTCDAGFEGSYYADFVDNCVDPANLTNGVTFRISGEASQKHVTGDTGQKGQTTFTQLPSGGYTLEEEPPAGATTVYGFCGLDPDAPDFKSVDEDISFNLGEGDVLTCTFFNIPADLTDSTGAIKVTKYVCDLPGNKRPANFDWFANCSIETDGVKFTLSVSQSGKFVPKSTGITNADGILNFSNLKPGTYQLKEVGADWCHAESDNVNPQGNVIVKAGQRSNVWIFNCVPTKNPPNTGAGTTAPPQAAQPTVTLSGFDPANNGDALLLAAIWPILGLVFYCWRRTTRRPYRRAA
ncbi:MAG TPA: SpaA isopeptide-forming pilin-related protein, partial [Thermomicrobiales bacterium]|nr:SpaA isopeptide-forming pilin-related protein [Thermomicrobiales bacterium]